MPNCPSCRAEVERGVPNCPSCGAQFHWPEVSAAGATYLPAEHERPDGGTLMGTGAACAVIGAVAFLIALMKEVDGLDGLATQWTLTLLVGALFQLGLFLGVAGVIVRPIWFLPGEETKRPRR